MINNISDCTTLNNGVKMPWLGFGVYLIPDGDKVINSVKEALNIGYRHIDTAYIYKNEKGVGQAIKESPIPREDIFVTTKIWNEDLRQQRVAEAFEKSLELLDMDYIDLYLIHWPVKNYYVDAWKEMEKIYASGRAKAIGVSNFTIEQLKVLEANSDLVPTVNQVEFHPHLVQPELLKYCKEKNIQFEAWSPLMQGRIMNLQAAKNLGEKYGKTPAQIALRWNLQHGVVTIPKSSKPHRILENAQLFDFEISKADMAILDAHDRGERIGPDPNNFNF